MRRHDHMTDLAAQVDQKPNLIRTQLSKTTFIMINFSVFYLFPLGMEPDNTDARNINRYKPFNKYY